jgi:hypothetical protein
MTLKAVTKDWKQENKKCLVADGLAVRSKWHLIYFPERRPIK